MEHAHVRRVRAGKNASSARHQGAHQGARQGGGGGRRQVHLTPPAVPVHILRTSWAVAASPKSEPQTRAGHLHLADRVQNGTARDDVAFFVSLEGKAAPPTYVSTARIGEDNFSFGDLVKRVHECVGLPPGDNRELGLSQSSAVGGVPTAAAPPSLGSLPFENALLLLGEGVNVVTLNGREWLSVHFVLRVKGAPPARDDAVVVTASSLQAAAVFQANLQQIAADAAVSRAVKLEAELAVAQAAVIAARVAATSAQEAVVALRATATSPAAPDSPTAGGMSASPGAPSPGVHRAAATHAQPSPPRSSYAAAARVGAEVGSAASSGSQSPSAGAAPPAKRGRISPSQGGSGSPPRPAEGHPPSTGGPQARRVSPTALVASSAAPSIARPSHVSPRDSGRPAPQAGRGPGAGGGTSLGGRA